MKNIKNLTKILALSLALIVSACSDKKSSDEDTNIDTNNTIEDTIIVQDCSDVSDDANTEILSGDTLTSEDANTTVKLTYNEDGSNYVCVVSGGAFIKR